MVIAGGGLSAIFKLRRLTKRPVIRLRGAFLSAAARMLLFHTTVRLFRIHQRYVSPFLLTPHAALQEPAGAGMVPMNRTNCHLPPWLVRPARAAGMRKDSQPT